MNSLDIFPQLLAELNHKSRHEISLNAHKLKFVKTSLVPYQDVESNLCDFLKICHAEQSYPEMMSHVSELNQESRLCELILVLIRMAEDQMDHHVAMFEDIIKIVHRVREMEDDGTNFHEKAIDRCSLLVYGSFAVLRPLRKKIIEIAKTYHVPYFYDSDDDSSIRLRSSLLTTYKNLNIVMEDFSVLCEALWFVRNYSYFENSQEQSAHKGPDQQQQTKSETTTEESSGGKSNQ